jgi:hypothetical protein
VALCAGLFLFAACGGDDGGLVLGGDAAQQPDTGDATSGPTTDAETTTVTTVAVVVTTASVSTAPTTAPKPTAPSTTAKAVVTAPPTTAKPQPTTTAPLVTFVEFSVVAPAACPAPDVSVPITPEVTVSWKLAGVIPDDVYVAVDNVNGPYETGLPTQGSVTLTYPCDGNKHTYYVVAVVGDQQFVKSKKV